MVNKANSRREFLKKSSLTGLGAALGMGVPLSAFPQPEYTLKTGNIKGGSLHIKPRYHRWHVDPGVEWLETNTGYKTLDWTIPVSQTALVLLDVWQRHYIKDTEARGETIIQEKLVPLIAECRKKGMPIIHAPSPPVAKIHPNWVKLVSENEMTPQRDNWPPRDFLNLSGQFQSYRRPKEPREAEKQSLPPLRIHPDTQPLPNEPVVATGEELHRYCKKNGILFLIFAGFNTNACILSRDYGATQMSGRGYQVVLVRDCTTGMETKETQPTLSQTNGAILILEMFGQYSVTSEEMIKGLLV
ncbi:MAG TPA: isochorismatase family protein [Sphingobacteriaceae bacterium]